MLFIVNISSFAIIQIFNPEFWENPPNFILHSQATVAWSSIQNRKPQELRAASFIQDVMNYLSFLDNQSFLTFPQWIPDPSTDTENYNTGHISFGNYFYHVGHFAIWGKQREEIYYWWFALHC